MNTVLVADDSSTMRKIIIRTLNAIGITDFVEAIDGVEAVELFEPGKFSMVVVDWNMPGKMGIEVIAEIREQDCNVPIIFIVTWAERSRGEKAIKAGASDYIAKPFTADTLRDKLEKLNII